MSKHDIEITDYRVESERPRAFVVMQFSPPYNELYGQVVKPICLEYGIRAERADDTFGPGVIMQDIARQMLECTMVIADITPANPNVYYEVGYAHALAKPTILIAASGLKLPFDLSGFRKLFYENTIERKLRIEEGLRKHLSAILSATGALKGYRAEQVTRPQCAPSAELALQLLRASSHDRVRERADA